VEEIEYARKRLEDYGFIPFFADRALDHIRIGDLPESAASPARNSGRFPLSEKSATFRDHALI
jgi:hypothetical protein